MTEDEILGGVLDREGGWRDQVTRPDGSIDPATNKGITLETLRAWRRAIGHLDTTIADLQALTDTEARTIYASMFVDVPGFTVANIPYEPLRVQLIDFGINSGPATAIRWLQRVIGLWGADVDGAFGPTTKGRLAAVGGTDDIHWRLINDALVAARSYMIDRLEDTGKLRPQDEEGVESRALSFFLAKP